MQALTEAIKYLYQQFILRDVVAYVAPGTILAACLLRVHFRGLDPAITFIQGIPKIADIPIYGLLFTMGLGIQSFGQLIRVLKEHNRKHDCKDTKRHLDDELRFEKLRDFHRVLLFRQTTDQRNDYAEWMERTRERIEVKKYASGNIALALVMGAVMTLVAKLSWNAGRWAILATGAILAISLIYENHVQANYAAIWEDKGIDNHSKD